MISLRDSQPRASGAHARRSSSRRLCVLRLPSQRQPGSYLYCLPRDSQPRASGAHARRSSSRRLCVLRLPRERQPGSSLYCACRGGASCGPAAPTRAAAPPGGSVYCACYAKASRGPAAPARAAAPPAGRHNLFIGTFFFRKDFFPAFSHLVRGFEEAFDVLILGVCKIPPPVHQVTDDVRMSSSYVFHQ